MSVHDPAGVLQPKPLLMWLRDQRDSAREMSRDYEEQGDEYDMARWSGFAEALDMTIQHISYGDLP